MTTLQHYRLYFIFTFLLESIFVLFRAVLIWKYDIQLDIEFYLFALRMDTIVVSLLLFIPILLFSVKLEKIAQYLMVLILMLILFLESVNIFFFDEFNTRLNYLFVEYLSYPKEVFKMIWESYKGSFISLMIILIIFYWMLLRFLCIHKSDLRLSKRLLLLPFILLFLFLGMRSSFDSSTPNQSFYSYSNSTLKNDIVNNTFFSLVYSVYLKSKEKMPDFGEIDDRENLISKMQQHTTNRYIGANSPLRFQKSTYKQKNHIVLVMVESFGSSYIGAMGGTPVSPKFDAISKKGFFASNMYSSSNRSNRGFEAILTSAFPVFSDTYLKLSKSQKEFYSVARTMKRNGYETIFLYGGDSKFDNMKGFAMSNGFNQVLDNNDFSPSIKRYTWGVSDEELYKKAQTILKSYKNKKLFLAMFTLSSHKPFDYPDGVIELYPKEKKESFANSIKYADYAFGDFYTKLQKDNFFANSLLIAVADHNAHMLGDKIVPINEYKIPALFLSNDINPKRFDGVSHQIDIAPTLFDFAGIDVTFPSFGTNLVKNTKSRALFLHKNNFVYLKDEAFVVYQAGKKSQVFDKNYNTITDTNISKEGLDFLYGTEYIYTKQLHKEIKE